MLHPFGTGRTRTVRGVGAHTVTPRRPRRADCRVTQILLPTALTMRRADSTVAIGTALVTMAGGPGITADPVGPAPIPPPGVLLAADAVRPCMYAPAYAGSAWCARPRQVGSTRVRGRRQRTGGGL